MQEKPIFHPNDQFSLKKILLIWVLSALPMGILAFGLTPHLAAITGIPVLMAYWLSINIGLVWQFVLGLLVLKREGCSMDWRSIAQRAWFQKPINPKTGAQSLALLWWTLPFILLSALLQSGVLAIPSIDDLLARWISMLPQYDLSGLASPEYQGAWWLLGLFVFTAVFNYLLGEEFMYRGILLPKMKGVFGKWDWLANGVLFGFYHLHKPQVVLSTALYFGLVFALPARIFRSSWMAVIIHGLEGILGIIVILGIVLGMAPG
jgi:membrane protease YdiL (CAAX protease family)